MCRMIAYVGDSSADLESLFAVFRQGSKCDPYATAAFGVGCTGHPHGWGCALLDGSRLHHYRSALPVWEDDFRLPKLQGNKLFTVFHSRLASDPSLDKPISSHPFVAATDREVLLLAHNGGVEVAVGTPKSFVDTEWALGVVAKQGGLEEALPELKSSTKDNSALNLVVMAIPRDKNAEPGVYCLNYFKANDPARAAYYRMYRAGLGRGQLFISSTFKDLGIGGLSNLSEAPFGDLFTLGA
jgi:predicted glutamine amidotransferase